MSDYRRPSLFWPLVLIGLGALLLLENFGLLPAGWWPALVQLWPVIFILLGLDMLVGRRSPAGTAFVLIVGALVVAGALTWAALRASQTPAGQAQALIQSQQGAERLDVRLRFSAGELRVEALGPSDYVMEGNVRNGPGESVAQEYRVSNGAGRLGLRQETSPLLLPFLALRNATALWEIRLTPELPLNLEVSTGAGATRLDLADLALEHLDLSTGVGQTEVTFPARAAEAEVSTGVGDTLLRLPAGIAARITVRSGLTSVDAPARFSRSDNVYTTPGFDAEGEFLDLDVNAGIGQVTIE
jgi:hypothetical protein